MLNNKQHHLQAVRRAIELRESLLPSISPAEECPYCDDPDCPKSYQDHIQQEIEGLRALEQILQGSGDSLWNILTQKYDLDVEEYLEVNVQFLESIWKALQTDESAHVSESDIGVVNYILFLITHAYRHDCHYPGATVTEDEEERLATWQIGLQRWILEQVYEWMLDQWSKFSPGRPGPRNGWGQYN